MTTLATALKSSFDRSEPPQIGEVQSAPVETNPLRLLRATSGGSSTAESANGFQNNMEMFDVVCALHDLDSCMEYIPFEATETISYSYITNPDMNASPLHMSISRFTNISKIMNSKSILTSADLDSSLDLDLDLA